MNIFVDELPITFEEGLAFQRLRRHSATDGNWIICERFDDRFDTEVGGLVFEVPAYVTVDGRASAELCSLHLEAPLRRREPPVIRDYRDRGRAISLEEARARPELAVVLSRLEERIIAHQAARPGARSGSL